MADLTKNRPLSPHLQVYKFIPTMAASIFHRLTGVALYFGTLLVAWWLIAAASDEAYFDFVRAILGSFIGQLVLFGYTWVLIHHLLGGLRHFMWDLGYGFEKHFTTYLVKVCAIFAPVLAAAIWIVAFLVR